MTSKKIIRMIGKSGVVLGSMLALQAITETEVSADTLNEPVQSSQTTSEATGEKEPAVIESQNDSQETSANQTGSVDQTPSATAVSDGKLATDFETATITESDKTESWSVPASLTAVKDEMDIAFYVDASGSMNSVLDDMKDGVEQYVDNLHTAGASDVRVAVINMNGDTVSDFSAYNKTNFSNDLDGLNYHGAEGSANDLSESIKNIGWRTDATKNVVIIADTYLGKYDSNKQNIEGSTSQSLQSLIDTINGDEKIVLSLMYADDQGFNDPVDDYDYIASQTNSKVYRVTDDKNLVDSLTQSVVNPTGDTQSHIYESKVEVLYVSDGSQSSDLRVTVTPSQFVLKSGEIGQFNIAVTSVSEDKIKRINDTTKVIIHYYVDGVEDISKQQTVFFAPQESILEPVISVPTETTLSEQQNMKFVPTVATVNQEIETINNDASVQINSTIMEKTLPKMGEKENKLVALGMVMLSFSGLSFLVKRRKSN